MKNIYEECPVLNGGRFMLRKTELIDADDLLKVYSDKNALPFFNSDNCNGDNFYYSTKERMLEALEFWNLAYTNKWFARLSVLDTTTEEVIGTIEGCIRASYDAFNGCGILRLDLGSKYEKACVISDILSVIIKDFYDLFGCKSIITKVPVYAVERKAAAKKSGFVKSDELMIGNNDGYAYKDYWIIHR